MTKYLYLTIFTLFPYLLHGQCADWGIEAINLTNSTCVSNGSFKINLTGNTSSISNVIYYVTGPNINLNTSSNNFTGLEPGTYIVQAIGLCSGVSTSSSQIIVEIEGRYTKIAINTLEKRPNPICASGTTTYGIAAIVIDGGSAPYNIKITSAPSGYTGTTDFVGNSGENIINNLPNGMYTFSVTDDCTTTSSNFVVTEFDLATVITNIRLLGSEAEFDKIEGSNCFPAKIKSFYTTWSPWDRQFTDDEDFMSSLEYSVNTTGATPSVSSYKPFNMKDPANLIPLTPNGTIKDYYQGGSKYFHVFVKFCGTVYTKSIQIEAPQSSSTTVTSCSNYRIKLSLLRAPAICFPVIFTVTGSGFSQTITLNSYQNTDVITTNVLPVGGYVIKFKTNDGYEYAQANHPVTTADPYWVNHPSSIQNYSPLHQRFPRLILSSRRDPAIGNIKVKLISSPGNYAKFEHTFPKQSDLSSGMFNQNVDETHPDYYWRPGDYIFQVTDDCNATPINVSIKLLESSAAYNNFALDVSDQTITCNGMEVKPIASSIGKATNILTTVVDVDGVYKEYPFVSNGQAITLITPGVYTFAATARSFNITGLRVKIPQMRTEVINYKGAAPIIDLEKSQGFACLGETTGQIIVKATGGSGILKYELYKTGVKEDENIIGIFDILPKNGEYIVKVIDECNNAVNQPFKVYDMATIQIVTPNKTDFCVGEDLEFKTFVLPDATYSWTGPNGFTSTEQHPKRENLTLADAGQYSVVITTPHCGGIPITHSVTITVRNGTPPPIIADITATAIIGGQAKMTLQNAIIGSEYTVTDNSLVFISKGVSVASPFVMGLEKIYYEEETNRISISASASCGASTSNTPFQVKVKASDINLLDSCSFTPKLGVVNLLDVSLTLTWQKKNGSGWTNVGTGIELPISEAGEYQLEMKKDSKPTVISDTIKVKLLKKAQIVNRVWYSFETE